MDIILATGGTGGHIFPAITLARAIKRRGYDSILFTDRKIDKNTDVKNYILPLSKPSGSKFRFFLLLMYSCVLALYQIRKLKPKLVIGFGSYASFPTLFAAKVLSIPIILHEQNTILGRVNKFFFNNAELIVTSFQETKYAKGNKCVYIGNFIDIKAKSHSGSEKVLTLLIIAGSQGANFFDNVVSSVICNLPIEMKKNIRVVQQCTKKNMNKIWNLYKKGKVSCELSEFFDDIRSRLINAHLVISRAGATSIAEITLARRPAIYIPYPYSKDDHQFYNAKCIKDSGAAVIVEQNSEAKENLAKLLVNLLSDSQKLCDMANNTKKVKIKNGVTEFTRIVIHKLG
ncbi:UDP-N-acetylglucosamine--N-acetylmuramyl-(pentapeptide) pyrophosphoryl-undecaprenol N-acetylglucosamine transferase [Wolbachia endosymbiont of Litomosoides sigmodontis]|uniref:UDP-N-acetylglucosamine--N-acetylmuramyl- (pentapeptide) pyrophosphoryl-undecaprenol N-acetylglucosamine transferase n=1 Tax=Wolbachia endosymbiont of Litomosoides sigmodontis TaxID=80850 RepID=UPI00158946F7|nr:UDP-N-acetylglucosamine--N-acetylmuramyl-(pentapeptide) pyrophosphoryl-undecaprenol N-acetylglucosamine transferase [Wolbachia endosymbiont of Litomosoides sigmodontis]QKX02793.1 UDP-N-acetylglucosamine--N-acetylmuramyl-(pentapeptide) pyrophosphoryl-undecaprenol N-acetylglucosamine transferase [Wolbachia endosymbiont of Litomosoides sigmodontis]